MKTQIDGIYTCYMAGAEGNGFAMFVFRSGNICGADPLGVKFDGKYNLQADDVYAVEVTVSVPQGGLVVQGVSSGPSGITYTVNLSLTADFAEKDFVEVPTPLGPVNARFQKVRGLEALDDGI